MKILPSGAFTNKNDRNWPHRPHTFKEKLLKYIVKQTIYTSTQVHMKEQKVNNN